MLCEICKTNQATIHIQELSKQGKTTLHICKNCSVEKGLNTIDLQGINIAEILYKLSASTEGLLPEPEKIQSNTPLDNEAVTNIVCPKCKWEVRRFQKTGRLGCEACYHAFSEILSETLCHMHKGIIHTGRCPELRENGIGLQLLDILNLQKQLDIHVLREEYEEAAKIRDQIHELKKDINTETNEK